jgi:hypothetical protein
MRGPLQVNRVTAFAAHGSNSQKADSRALMPLAEVACRITISFLRTFAALVFDPAFGTVQG